MNTLSRLALTVAVGAFTVPALAATPTAADVAAHNALLSTLRAGPAKDQTAAAAGAKAYGHNTSPGSPTPNAYRTYPPSCAAYPLPDAPSGPAGQIYTTTMQFWTRDAAGNPVTPEVVGVTIWRIACSSGGYVTPYNTTGNFYNSMTLMRVDRDASVDHHRDLPYPTFPFLQTNQGTTDLTDDSTRVRAAAEPNTVMADGSYDSPIYDSTTYVLENFNLGANYYHEYNDAFTLIINPGLGDPDPGVRTFDIAAYSPTTSTYPDAFNPLPIDGYLSTSWFSPDHGGEGMEVQVYDGDANSRTFTAGWYASDSTGRPFWLFAQGNVPIGATTVQTTAVYVSGGGFAGSAGNATTNQWGTVTFSFPDCNHMHFTYNGQTDAATAGPSGNGTRDWIRVANTNGLACE